MNKSNFERIDEFLQTLGAVLDRNHRQSCETLEEVRADLFTHIKRYQLEGYSEDDAVGRAFDQMGNPYELAYHIRREVPPFGGEFLTSIRYVVASGVFLWMVVMLWHIRAWSYGATGTAVVVGVMLLHLPVILLLWPRIIWKKNWLFGLAPAGLALVIALGMYVAGVNSQQQTRELVVPLAEQEVAALATMNEEPNFSGVNVKTAMTVCVFGIAVIVTIIIGLLAMQQRIQRRIVVLAALLTFAVIEGPMQLEEYLFRRDRAQVQGFFDKAVEQNGTYPTAEDFKANKPLLSNDHFYLRVNDDRFNFFWTRPFCSGFAICCSSDNDQVWIQD